MALSENVNRAEMANSVQLNEYSILLRIEFEDVCNKVYGYVGTSLLLEWFNEILKTRETKEVKQSLSIEEGKDLPSHQFDKCELLTTERLDSPSSSVYSLNSSEHIGDNSSVVNSDVGHQQKVNLDQHSDPGLQKQGVKLREGFGSLGIHFYERINGKTELLDNTAQHNLQVDIEDQQNSAIAGITHLDLNNSHDEPKPQCEICSRIFRSDLGLKLHLRMHKKLQDPPICPHCGKQFTVYNRLQKHLSIHTGERPHVCTKCDKTFRTVVLLRSHMKTHSDKRRFMCDIEDIEDAQRSMMKEINNSNLNSHDDGNTKPKFQCEICSRICRNDVGLKLHLRMHKKLPGAPVCHHCGLQLKNYSGLQEHLRLHTGERPHVCTKCDKSFRTSSLLKEHIRIHSDERLFKCQQCDKSYKARSMLSEHVQYVHSNGIRPYICMCCSQTYPTRGGLRMHEARCRSDSTYDCEYCDKKYRNINDLKHHRRIHTGEKVWVRASQECTYCKKVFGNHYIQLHIRQVHKKERPFKCSQCDMTFAMLNSLKSHQLVHSGERAFACTQCDKRLASAYALRNHEAKHRASSLSVKKLNNADKKMLSCVHCNERFVRSSNLTVHVKMFHSVPQDGSIGCNSSISGDT